MGPIHDFLGLEKGNVNSDRLYKLCNNNQLSTAQLSQLGISCGPVVVSSVGQADDTIILSDCIYKLSCLVNLAEEYCSNFHVTLVPEKTKLVVFSSASHTHSVNLAKLVNPISVAGKPISFTDSAEHVGILQSDQAGNMPHILGRLAAHRRALPRPTGETRRPACGWSGLTVRLSFSPVSLRSFSTPLNSQHYTNTTNLVLDKSFGSRSPYLSVSSCLWREVFLP